MGRLDLLAWRLRPLLPDPARKVAKLALNAADPVAVWAHRRRTGERRPVPPRELRTRVGSATIESYFQEGDTTARAIVGGAEAAGVGAAGLESVLDFGCGCARTLQAISAIDGPRLFGCDVDAEAVGWARGALSFGEFATNAFRPPLPYEDGSFDAVYSVSVFTHLTQADQAEWLEELARVLRPGGLCLASVHGESARSATWWGKGLSREAATTLNRRLADDPAEFVFVAYEDLASEPGKYPGVDSTYGISFQSAAWTRRHWSTHFEIVEVREGAIDSFQDLVVLRKPMSS